LEANEDGGPFKLNIADVIEELLSRLAADWRDGRETSDACKEDDDDVGPGLPTDCAIMELDEAPSTTVVFLEATSFSYTSLFL
jgi:hypothetical protein